MGGAASTSADKSALEGTERRLSKSEFDKAAKSLWEKVASKSGESPGGADVSVDDLKSAARAFLKTIVDEKDDVKELQLPLQHPPHTSKHVSDREFWACSRFWLGEAGVFWVEG